MEGYVIDPRGDVTALPVLLEWNIVHSMENCDAFEVRMPLTEGLADTLAAAAEFHCTHLGQTVFRGVVDEYELRAEAGSALAVLAGRGRGAYLMDSEAESAEYWSPGIALILARHVYPWRISDVRWQPMAAAGRFPVRAGESHWKVLKNFCYFAGGVAPRFDRQGTLLLNGEAGETVTLRDAPVSRQVWRAQRSGVISQVLVKNPVWGMTAAVDNAAAAEKGILCRRVLHVPRYTVYDRMRHTGAYQIRQSEQGKNVLSLTLPVLFAAFAGDTVALEGSPLGLQGRYRVRESRCTADARSAETHLTLEKEE